MRQLFRSAGFALAACWLSLAYAQPTQFEARLATVPIDPATQSDVTGHGRVTAELRGTALRLRGSFEGMQGPATAARLHAGPVTGVRGAPIAELDVEQAAAGSISATLELTPEQVDALRAGRLYVQVHSEKAPEGNLWGWLLQ